MYPKCHAISRWIRQQRCLSLSDFIANLLVTRKMGKCCGFTDYFSNALHSINHTACVERVHTLKASFFGMWIADTAKNIFSLLNYHLSAFTRVFTWKNNIWRIRNEKGQRKMWWLQLSDHHHRTRRQIMMTCQWRIKRFLFSLKKRKSSRYLVKSESSRCSTNSLASLSILSISRIMWPSFIVVCL